MGQTRYCPENSTHINSFVISGAAARGPNAYGETQGPGKFHLTPSWERAAPGWEIEPPREPFSIPFPSGYSSGDLPDQDTLGVWM